VNLTLKNSMRPGTPEFDKPNADLSGLEELGYILKPIDTLRVLNANPRAKHPDYPLANQDIGRRYFDVVMSGPDTEVEFGTWPAPPMGPVLRNGHLDTEGTGRGHFRGVVAILEDGTVLVDRADGASEKDLKQRFSSKGNPLVGLCGGGALLVHNGRKVGDIDLMRNQLYGGVPGGIRARSMLKGVHLYIGIRKGKAYAGITFGRSALNMQEDFIAFGFGAMVKFANGGDVYFNDGETLITGQSAVGLGIKVRR